MKIKTLAPFLIAAMLLSFFGNDLFANPGDTTWVTVWNQRKLTQYGNYDTTANFPSGKRFRKIRLHYILGRYGCPPGSQYCGSWDYTTQIYARPTGLDSVEIARVITPYATDWLSQNRKHDYVIEVTDYAKALEGSTGMRFNYSGYSWGFTITLKIEFIEGIPPMDALSVKNIYRGYFAFGNVNNPIENHLSPKTFSYSGTGHRLFVKNSVSGHGADSLDCAEFCSKYYRLKMNGVLHSQKQLWRNTCGINEVYPQTGTWIFDRANWCPGAVVWPIYHDVTQNTQPSTTFTVDVDMQTYTVTNPSAGYQWDSQLIDYSAPNHSRDVSIEDVISPSPDPNYHRENPACRNPVIHIRNVGTDTVHQVVFQYGLRGNSAQSFTWQGTLAFLDTTLVIFPPSVSMLSGTQSAVFDVKILAVNGLTGDQNSFNNVYSSKTTPVEEFPKDFIIKMYTNNGTDTANGKNETSWKLYDRNGLVLKSRSLLNNSTVYLDTLRNLPPGCYKMVVRDAGCDGYNWWFYPNYPVNPGIGSLRVDYINANNTIASFGGDFGCEVSKYFMVLDSNYTGLKEGSELANRISVYPNPVQDKFSLSFDLNSEHEVSAYLYDLSGKCVKEYVFGTLQHKIVEMNTTGLKDGVYMLNCRLDNGLVISNKVIIHR